MRSVITKVLMLSVSVWFTSLTPQTNSPGVVRATLGNGLRVVTVRNTLAPVVTTEINYLTGSNEAPDGFPGMAHAQEHMMFRGSPNLPADQLAEITAAMGGDFNADTQQTVTQYFFTVPADQLEIALRIEALRMQGVVDSENLWQPERGAIEQEVARDLSSPTYVFYMKLLSEMFAGTPYSHDALARALVERDLREMQTTPVPAAELRRAKTILLRQIPLSESSVSGIAAGLVGRSLLDLPLDEPARAAKRYIETTAADVQAAFAKWIRLPGFVQVTLGPAPF